MRVRVRAYDFNHTLIGVETFDLAHWSRFAWNIGDAAFIVEIERIDESPALPRDVAADACDAGTCRCDP